MGRPLATQRLDDNSATRLAYLLDRTYVRDPAGKWRMSRTDALGRLVEVAEDPLVDGSATNPIPGYSNASGASLATLYTYDGRDNLLSVTQGTQPPRVFTYDALGRLSTALNPESDTTTYAYYDNGNLKTKTDSDSIVAFTTWDALNRLKTKSYTGGVSTPAVTYCYDGDAAGGCSGAPSGSPGNLTMVINSSYTTRYAGYDGLRRVTASSQQFASDAAYAFSYTYNKAGGLETETFPSNRQVKTCYNQAGQPKSVQNPANSLNYASNVQYAAHGGMTSATLGNGITETWGYTRMQPTSMAAGSLLSLTMAYGSSDNNGNVLSRTINDGTASFSQTFVYDTLNRLTSLTETGTGLTQTYDYDRWGNRAVTAGWVPGASLTPQALTAYTTNTNRWTGVGVDYNNRGLQTALPARGYTFDAESRLVTATDTIGTSAQYAYDGEGRRVKKTVNTVETRFVYDAFGRLAAEYGGSSSGPCSTCYLTADHLGSTRLVTNQSGAMVKRYDYLPFGEEVPTGAFNRGTAYSSGSYPAQPDAVASLKFTGKERDAESSLDWFESRYFSAAQGRFTSPDAMLAKKEWLPDPQRWNRYAYVRNNPLRFVDPNGEDLIVYYFDSQNLTEEQRKWLEANRQKVLATIRDRFTKAGIKNVEFRPGSSLTDDQVRQLPGRLGLGQLNFQDTTNVVGERLGVGTKEQTLGKSGLGMGPSQVFLGNLSDWSFSGLRVPGFGLSGSDLAVGAGEVGAHELGHRLGLDVVPESMYRLTFDNLMTEGMGNPSSPLYFKPTKDDRRVIDEINRIGDNTPKRRD